jgi:O-antigen/teichoic acid export membrane protein
MRIVLLASVSIMVLSAYRAVMRAIPLGLQQTVPPSYAVIVGNTVNFVFSVVALALSRDLVVYALANAAAAVVALLPMLIALRHTWSPLRVRMPSGEIVKEVLGFSLKTQLAFIGNLINNQTDKIIIGVVIDVRAAGAYEIANRESSWR